MRLKKDNDDDDGDDNIIYYCSVHCATCSKNALVNCSCRFYLLTAACSAAGSEWWKLSNGWVAGDDNEFAAVFSISSAQPSRNRRSAAAARCEGPSHTHDGGAATVAWHSSSADLRVIRRLNRHQLPLSPTPFTAVAPRTEPNGVLSATISHRHQSSQRNTVAAAQ